MSHILAISVGPVQEFIAAARRTRDLWFGSNLLSEVSRAVAKEVENQGGNLIFPASLDADNVANVILAELPVGAPKETASKAKEAAKRQWRDFAEQARSEAPSVVAPDLWNDQVDDVIEFYAAWVPHTDPSNYRNDRARVMRLLAGRKNCRDFLRAEGRAGVPKSSLDGQRETVLKSGDRSNWPEKLRLSSGEQLDVVGITKRLGKKQGHGDQHYPSVARVAAETWLRGVQDRAGFAELWTACAAVPGLHKVAEPNYGYFPYEGTVIYKDRHPDLIAELGKVVEEPLKRVAARLGELGGDPTPYVAVLVADGDGMGAALSKLESADAHRKLSAKLATFASAAKAIVAEHSGVLVYAGGDDVLAFAPVHTCLKCARALRDRFRQETGMTLSVGLAIGHFMENLEDLRDYGQQAEKAAKGLKGKDALAVHLHKRGGAPIKYRAKWTDSPDQRILRFAGLINEKILPGKLPYELSAMARVYADWPADQAEAAIKIDLVRLVAKKQSKGIETVKQKLAPELKGMNAMRLLKLAVELLVARHIADSLQQAAEAAL